MVSPTTFRRIRSARALTTAVLCSALVLISVITFYPERLGHAANHKRQQLTFEDRVIAQRAIEAVYHQRRLWPTENPQPKPPLDDVMPDAAIRAKVEDYLRKSSALEVYWQRPVTAADLQAEVERMARDTRQPDVLGELWAALGNDPMLIAECLARPLLVERLAREAYEEAEGGRMKEEAKADSLPPSSRSLQPFDEWWSGVRTQMAMAAAVSGEYRLPEIAAVAAPCGIGAWTATSTTGAPSGGRSAHSAVWTGTEMIIWGGGSSGSSAFNTGGKYTPATDSWIASIATTGAPSARNHHSAVWTGSEMIVWGGDGSLNPGGRYNPATDSWTANIATTGAPSGRGGHSAVWTGTEMIVWGGYIGTSSLNTGGRYNPAADSWTANITTAGAPSARDHHTAVWTGTEMIVWGGTTGGSSSGSGSNTGGRYNPLTDSWTTNVTTSGAPTGRSAHTAVWTGSEMIVWGGVSNTGGRYNPTADFWVAATTTTGAPSTREHHSAVWTGNEMIVWGGGSFSNTGGRYSIPQPLTISQTTQSFPTTGGTSNIVVTAPGGCTWTATSNANWLTITAGSSGAGNGTVAFAVAANTLGPRTGILTIGTQTFIVRQAGVATPRVIRVATTGSAPGNIAVPLEIVSQGDENALGFTLTFDPAVLGNPQVAPGIDAVGGALSTNTNQVAQGRIGIAYALAAGQKFAAGTRQFAVVTFTTPANLTSGMTPLDFDDLPLAREVSDVSANALPASYQGGSISIVSGFESDVAPRPQGNGSVTITDWVQIGRFAAGLDTAAAGVEFQRADCAPRSTFGDGRLTVADWTQAGRYATGADAVAAAGGPTLQASQSLSANPDSSPAPSLAGGHRPAARQQPSVIRGRWLAAETPEQTANDNRRMTGFIVEIVARGDENALGFSLQFDPAQWSLVSAATGRDTQGATLHVNASQAARGRIGVALAMAAGQRLNAGARQIVIVRLSARGGRGAIEFSDYPVKREVVDAEANVTPSAFAIDRNRKHK